MTKKERRKKNTLHHKYIKQMELAKIGKVKTRERPAEAFPSFARCSGIYHSVYAKY